MRNLSKNIWVRGQDITALKARCYVCKCSCERQSFGHKAGNIINGNCFSNVLCQSGAVDKSPTSYQRISCLAAGDNGSSDGEKESMTILCGLWLVFQEEQMVQLQSQRGVLCKVVRKGQHPPAGYTLIPWPQQIQQSQWDNFKLQADPWNSSWDWWRMYLDRCSTWKWTINKLLIINLNVYTCI